MDNSNTLQAVNDIILAWRAIPNLVIDQGSLKTAQDFEYWLDGADLANEDMLREAHEVRVDLEEFDSDSEDDLDQAEPALSPEEEFAAHMRSSAMCEMREELLRELISLDAWDAAIKLVVELEDMVCLELVFGELAKDGKAGRARAELISAKLPQSIKYQLCFELFHQTGSELFLNYVQLRVVSELSKKGTLKRDRANCATYANLLINLWCLRQNSELLDMAIILTIGGEDWVTWVKLARATGQLSHYLHLLELMQRQTGQILVDAVMQVADMLAASVRINHSPDSVPNAIKQFFRPLSEQDLQAFLNEVPPQHRKVYEKRLQQIALDPPPSVSEEE